MHAVHPPEFPAGPNPGPFDNHVTLAAIRPSVEALSAIPRRLREVVAGLGAAQLDTKYRNWTVRQIAYHLADAHMHVYIRWKLALTEDVPTIKPWSESAWADLEHAKAGPMEAALLLNDAVHTAWVDLIRSLSLRDMMREFFHPEINQRVRLVDMLRTYAWHGEHHLRQIEWLRSTRGWE